MEITRITSQKILVKISLARGKYLYNLSSASAAMDKVPLLSSLNSSQSFYPEPSREAELLRYTHADIQATPRVSNEVEVISGAKVHIRVVVDGVLLGEKHVKVQVFPQSTVLALFSTIRVEWAVDSNALSLAGDKVRYVDQLVKENGALLLPRYPAALLFPDKGSNTAVIEITYLYERLEKPCCSRCMLLSLGVSALVAVIVRVKCHAAHKLAMALTRSQCTYLCSPSVAFYSLPSPWPVFLQLVIMYFVLIRGF